MSTKSIQEGPGPHEHPNTRRGSVGTQAPPGCTGPHADWCPVHPRAVEPQSAAAPDAELDELLAAALPCRHWPEGSVAAKACAAGDHWHGCPGAYRPALRRHLAAWAAAQRAEAELLRRALGMDTPHSVHDVLSELRKAAQHLLAHHNCDCHGYERIGVATEASRDLEQDIAAALARPRPSASGLLELLTELRRAKLVCPDCSGDGEDAPTCAMCGGEGVLEDGAMRGVARRLAAELGLEAG